MSGSRARLFLLCCTLAGCQVASSGCYIGPSPGGRCDGWQPGAQLDWLRALVAPDTLVPGDLIFTLSEWRLNEYTNAALLTLEFVDVQVIESDPVSDYRWVLRPAAGADLGASVDVVCNRGGSDTTRAEAATLLPRSDFPSEGEEVELAFTVQ